MEELLFFIASGYTCINDEHLKDTAGRILANGLVYEFRKFLHDYLCYEYETKIAEIHLTELCDYEEALRHFANDYKEFLKKPFDSYFGFKEGTLKELRKIYAAKKEGGKTQ